MIAGLVQPSGGEIFINGASITRVPVHRRNIGMLFQSYALFPHLTVAENVIFGLEMRGIKHRAARQRVQEALDLVQLGGHQGKLPSQLSGGQQQRVAVARALAGSPAILLADEPTGNLDSRNAEAVMDLLRDLHREGATICMVTHDPRFSRHAERTIHMFDGRVVEESVEVN
jgi:putative ABC transport system ATP-binding protein